MGYIIVGLIGEGRNDYGIEGRMGNWEEGAVQPILRKFIPNAEFLPFPRKPRESRQFQTPSRKIPKFGPHAAHLRSYLETLSQKKGTLDLLIFYRDLDKQSGHRASENEAKRALRDAIEQVDQAFEYIESAYQVKCTAMIPMRMLENWLLADAEAFRTAFGSKPSRPALPNRPEFIWGDEQDRQSDHPKNYLQRVLNQYGKESTTENFILIAEASQVATLKSQCSNSFAPFAERLEILFPT